MTTSGNIIIVGSSTGGPRVLERLFDGIPKLQASVVIVHQMVDVMNQLLVDKLNKKTEMAVQLAESGANLEDGKVYIAPTNLHLRLLDNKTIDLFNGERRNRVRPSVDVTMESLQANAESKIVGIILTGAGQDGAEGISHIKGIGGMTMAQDQTTSPVTAMPKAAFETGNVDLVLDPEEMRQILISTFGKS
jgi:two-component system chemotaxis response regulator CheB